MSSKYRLGRRTAKKRYILAILLPVCLIVAGIIGLIYRDLQSNDDEIVEGPQNSIAQAGADDDQKLAINEPLFTMQFPADWKQASRSATAAEQSITWVATKKGKDARSIKLYIDTIPTTLPLNRLVPISAQGDGLSIGDASDNCATFTGASIDKTKSQSVAPAKWSGVDFLCALGSIDNQIGTGSVGGLNQVTLTGGQGTHKYFFLYIDRNIPPDYAIFQSALESFKVK